jgi:predicted HTH transcriptional regulator
MTLLDNRILCGSKTNYQITVAGWIIFAINPQSNSIFANAYIEFQMFRGITREEPIKKQAFKGNLPQQIKQSINMLLQNIWVIPKIEGIQRKDIPLYSTEILREVITNAVVHRDYKKMHQPVKIALFSDRIEIENPGGLMPGLTTLNLVHRRDWRNPLVAELMSKFGFGEMDGQGIDRLYVATLALKIPTPVFIDNKISFKVILSSPKKYELFEPNERRNTVLALLINNNTIDNEVVRDTFNITSHQAGTLLKALVREKIIQPVTISRKFAKYSLTDNYREKIFA